MEEIWRSIKGYEELYEVSNMGNVRSLPRATTKGKALKLQADKDGYLKACLSKQNKSKTIPVHRLVADAFVEGKTETKNIINHINEIKSDNRAINLEWCDSKYNTNYRNMPMRRADWCKKPIIARKNGKGWIFESVTQAARALGISHGNISSCLTGRRKTSKGYTFEYYKVGAKI